MENKSSYTQAEISAIFWLVKCNVKRFFQPLSAPLPPPHQPHPNRPLPGVCKLQSLKADLNINIERYAKRADTRLVDQIQSRYKKTGTTCFLT